MPKVIVASLFLPVQYSNGKNWAKDATAICEDAHQCGTGNWRANNAALDDGVRALRKTGQQVEWVGLPGVDIPESMQEKLTSTLAKDHQSRPIYVDQKLHNGHYGVFCKSVLWPLFHFTIGSGTIITQADNEAWTYYVQVNELFANEIVNAYQPDDDILVHGYHLMLVPQMIRQRIPQASIGFFMHIPFPNTEIFRCLPRRQELLSGLLGSSLLGFQTYADARHFLHSCTRVLGYETSPTGVLIDPGFVHVGVFPVGVDVDNLNTKRQSAEVLEKRKALADTFGGRKVIIGRDKLDFLDGIKHKFLAFELFLEKYPEWREKVVLVQVTEPTIEQRHAHLESSLAGIVSHINSKYGSISMLPIMHYRTAIDEVEYLALLGMADVCLITSLRDGMNLISHEYVVSQQERHGCLLLSEFTGSAGSLSTAMHINPWDHNNVADSLNEALSMSEEEKTLKHQQLLSFVSRHTAAFWSISFLQDLRKASTYVQTSVAPCLGQSDLQNSYSAATHRLLLLDYDGTLTPIRRTPYAAKPSNRLLAALRKLLENPQNKLFIVSGRDQATLDEWLGQIPFIGLSAEHGCFLKLPDDEPLLNDSFHDIHSTTINQEMTIPNAGQSKNSWLSLADEMDFSWKADVLTAFEYYTERTPGSFIEHKKSSITWHYRLADPDYGSWQAKQCQAHLETLVISKYPIEILTGKKNLEVRPIATNKGEVIRRILSLYPETDFVFCVGDDRTDEDMFRFLKTLEQQHSMRSDNEADGTNPRKIQQQQDGTTSNGNNCNHVNKSPESPAAAATSTKTAVQQPESPPQLTPSVSRSMLNLKLPESIITCTVGVKNTQASYHVPDTETLLQLLQSVADM